MDVLVEGLGIPESLRWHDRRLRFCDWEAAEVRSLAANGRNEVEARVKTMS